VVAVVESEQHDHKIVVEDGPLRETVFDVIQGRVNEYACVVPRARLYPNSLVDECTLGESLVGDCYSYTWGTKTSFYIESQEKNSLCLLKRATCDPSWFHMMYLTGGVLSSEMVFCCWMS
jgi:hypothetical protein